MQRPCILCVFKLYLAIPVVVPSYLSKVKAKWGVLRVLDVIQIYSWYLL